MLQAAIINLENFLAQYELPFNISAGELLGHVKEYLGGSAKGIAKGLSIGIKQGFLELGSWISGLISFFLVPLFFFYLIEDYENIASSTKSMIPPRFRPKGESYAKAFNRILSGYLRGQFLVVVSLSVLYSSVLGLIGIKFALFLGIISGLISFIPYAGFTIGLVLALLTSLATNEPPMTLVKIIAGFLAVQALEGTILTPKLVGNKVQLSELSTLIALIIGGNFFGLIGLLIAIPFAALFKVILADLKHEYQAAISEF